MKNIFCLFAGVIGLLALSVAQTRAQDAPSSTVSATSSRAAREAAFLAALPHEADVSDTLDSQTQAEGEIAYFTSLNPGKGDVIHAIVTRKAACEKKASLMSIEQASQRIAHALSDDALSHLTTFFLSQDFRRYNEISDQATRTQANQAELEAISARYKKWMEEFDLEYTETMKMNHSRLLNFIKICTDGQSTAFAQARIKDAGAMALSALSIARGQNKSATTLPVASRRAAREAAFLAALPSEFDMLNQPWDEKDRIKTEVAYIASLNSDKGEAIRPIVARRVACETDVSRAAVGHALQEAAHTLPADTLSRLTIFFSSQDYQYFDKIQDKTQSAKVDYAELEANKKAMEEYLARLNKAMSTITENPEFRNLEKACADEQATAFAHLKIRDGE